MMRSVKHYYATTLLALLWFSFFSSVSAASTEQTSARVKSHALYKEECASCHMAYPSWLLPSRSWRKIMANLDNHFGDNASLDSATMQQISQYLQANSADAVDIRRARKITRSLRADDTPNRISELPYIKNKHDEVPARLIRSNPKVKSLSNCAACHQGAERGSFDDDNVRIPGYGRWED